MIPIIFVVAWAASDQLYLTHQLKLFIFKSVLDLPIGDLEKYRV